MSRHASIQTAYVGLEAIEDGLVRLVVGECRAVLEVGSVDFGLRADSEQEALVAGYAAFLNSLSFPVQVLVRVLPIEVEGYLGELERRARQGLSDELAALARDHIAFVRRLARNRTLLERRFYLVVPADGEVSPQRRSLFAGHRSAPGDASAARKQLTFRCEEIERGLGRCGLAARRLYDVELAQLYHGCWCPELSRAQRLRRELTEYTGLVVHGQDSKTHKRRSQ